MKIFHNAVVYTGDNFAGWTFINEDATGGMPEVPVLPEVPAEPEAPL